MRRALEMFVVEGIRNVHSIAPQRFLADPDFAAGRIDTHTFLKPIRHIARWINSYERCVPSPVCHNPTTFRCNRTTSELILGRSRWRNPGSKTLIQYPQLKSAASRQFFRKVSLQLSTARSPRAAAQIRVVNDRADIALLCKRGRRPCRAGRFGRQEESRAPSAEVNAEWAFRRTRWNR